MNCNSRNAHVVHGRMLPNGREAGQCRRVVYSSQQPVAKQAWSGELDAPKPGPQPNACAVVPFGSLL